jgi:hypothetical protein
VGPGNGDFFGPCETASSRKASAIWGPKRSPFPGPNPLQLSKWICLHQKHYMQGRVSQRSIGSFMYMNFCILYSVFLFCILYSVFCVLCSVSCILYSIFCGVCCEFYVMSFRAHPPMALTPLAVWVWRGAQ